ncbi:hypothetical protein F5887DRAFT_1197445 [Amanita rubescens]|nr:hypothetical protein F5887DRAFT_1197445 [Amanita rubescens]
MNLCYDEVFSELLLPEKEKGYRTSRKQMKTIYYELENRYERKREVRTDFSYTSSQELDLMSSTLHSWREALAAHKREHYSECSQLIFNHATEFDDFVAKYHASQFKFNLDHSLSRDSQYACHDAYLGLYDGSIDPEVISESFWMLVEHWDSICTAIFANGQAHPGSSQLPSTTDGPRPAAAVKATEEVPRTSESSMNDSPTSSVQTRHHPGLSPFESRNMPERVQMTHSQIPLELEGSAPSTLPETPKSLEHVTERSILIDGLTDAQVQIPFLSNEMREEQRVYNSVVSVHAKGEDISSPNTSAALALPEIVPISSPIPIPRVTPKAHPLALSCKHGSPRAIREVRRTRDSTSESRNALEQVQMTRSQTRLSSLKPDSVFIPRELQRNTWSSLTDNELSKARKTDLPGKPPSELSMETAATVSRTSSKPATCVKSRQLPELLVPVERSAKPRVVNTATPCVPNSRTASNLNARSGNMDVSTEEQAHASKYAPLTKTTLTLSKLSPVSFLRAHPSSRLTNEPKPSPLNVSKRHMPNVISMKQVVSRKAHLRSDARSGASLPTANRPFGKPPSSPNLEQSDQLKQAAKLLGSSFELPANIPERSAEHSILFGRLTNKQVASLSSFGETGEERRTLDAVISIQKEIKENNIPEASVALTLPGSAPVTIPVHPGPLRHLSLEEIHMQAIKEASRRVLAPETQNTLERVHMTRSEASPSSAKPDNPLEPPGLIKSPPNIAREPTSARIPILVKPVSEMVLPISRPSFSLCPPAKAKERLNNAVLKAREIPKGNSRIGIKPSNRNISAPSLKRWDVEKPAIGKAKFNPAKRTSAVKHLPAPKTAFSLSKTSPDLISSTRAPPTRPSRDRASLPFPAVSKQRASSVVNTNHVVDTNITHRLPETLSRVSNEFSSPPSGESSFSPATGEAKKSVKPKGGPTQSSGICERSAERSAQNQRLVGARVSTLSLSDERREKRRIYDTVVNIQINRSEENIPEDTAASTLPFSTSVPSFIRPAPTASTHPPLDETLSPIEVVTRQRVLNLVNKTSSASELPHSPYTRTARRQSQHALTLSRNEGGQLARAAAYIREHINRRPLTCDKSVRCSPEVPPDKIAEPESDFRRLNVQVVNNKIEASITIRSPESEEESEPSPIRPNAVLQQLKARRANELSSGQSEAIPRLPGPTLNEASNQWQRNLHAVSNVEMSINSCSPAPNTALTPLCSSAFTYPAQTSPSFQPRPVFLDSHRLVHPFTQSSLDLDWFQTS